MNIMLDLMKSMLERDEKAKSMNEAHAHERFERAEEQRFFACLASIRLRVNSGPQGRYLIIEHVSPLVKIKSVVDHAVHQLLPQPDYREMRDLGELTESLSNLH